MQREKKLRKQNVVTASNLFSFAACVGKSISSQQILCVLVRNPKERLTLLAMKNVSRKLRRIQEWISKNRVSFRQSYRARLTI